MASTPPTSSIVTALGGGSGIDMTALANNLAAATFGARTSRIDSRSETLERQISAAASLKSRILGLASAIGERVRTGDLAPTPSVTNGAVASASIGAGKASGTYSLEVTALAKAQAIASPAFAAATTPTGSGTLTFRFGAVAGAGFTEDPAHAPVSVTIASGATLADVASAINGAGAGLSAYVAQTTEGAKLVVKGKDGAANGFVIEAAETPGEEGLAALAWDPASAAPTRTLDSAGDAAFKLDGLAMTSGSNTVTNVAPGLSLQLTGTNPGAPTAIGFANPSPAITTVMQDLTAALNEIVAELSQDIAPQGGDLARDSGARMLRRELSRLAGTVVMPGATGDEPRTLADLGLATERDGTFRLDGTRLAATLKRSPEGAAAMFTNGLFGVFATVDKLARTVTKANDPGTLTGSINRYNGLKTRLTDERATLTEKQEAFRVNLVSRFAATDSRVGASRATLSFLQNQIDAWNSQNN
jgi:flagellar hook-associated protein 2